MCAYDTTIEESLNSGHAAEERLPRCLERNLLESKYFPAISQATLACVIVLSVIFVATSFNRLNHTDLWGHLNFGRWIVDQGTLPAADPFAAETRTSPFLNVPWLAQVLGYALISVAGPEGLILAHALLVTLACGVLMWAVRSRGVSVGWSVVAAVSVYLLSLPIVGTVRPQLFGMLGAACTLLACSQLPKQKHPLVWLPIVFLFWANLHGSFVMGVAMLGLTCLGTSWNVWRESGNFTRTIADARFQRMWLWLALSVVAACVNPAGPLLLVKVLSFGGNSALQYISEWRSLTPGSLTGVLFFTSLVIAAALLRMADRKLEIYDILMLVVFGLATLSAMRMLAWWAMIWTWSMIPLADSVWRRWKGEGEDEVERTAMMTVFAMGFVFMCLLLAPPTHSFISGHHRGIGATTSSGTPLFVADRLAQQKMNGRIFSPMDWADYLIWRNPDLQPLIYSHVHLVHSETFHEYQQIGMADPAWLKLARKNRLKYLVVNRTRNTDLLREILVAQFIAEPPLRVIYQDQQAVIAELLPVK